MIARMRKSEKGLTLIETLAALTVFSLMTLGITPLLLSSIKGSNTSRSFTIGKNAVVEAMEHVRGLPYFESIGSDVAVTSALPGMRRDVLDFYFPDTTAGPGGTGFNAAAGTTTVPPRPEKAFRTVCAEASKQPAPTAPLACPSDLPPGVTVTFDAQFVGPVAGSTPEVFNTSVVTVPTSYNWNSNGSETPPSQLLQMTITATWMLNGKARSFDLSSLVGNRKLTNEELRGEGRIDYTIQAATSFEADSGQLSTATLTAGDTTSEIDTRSIVGADFTSTAAKIQLTNQEFGIDPGGPVADLVGGSQALTAPPNVPTAPDATGVEATLQHPVLLQNLGFLNDSKVTGGGVQVVSGEPKALGGFDFSETGTASLWLDNQAEKGIESPLRLMDGEPIFSVESLETRTLKGSTYAESTSVDATSGRKVHATSHSEFGQLELFPTTFIASSGPVLRISDFVADLGCFSTANPATASATGSWSAKLEYYKADLDGYESIDLGGDEGGSADPVASLIADNPLVYDDVDDSKDVYLFEAEGKKGYLKTLSVVTKVDALEDSTGRQTNATLNGAISLETTAAHSLRPASTLSLSIGKLSCEAVDRRGL
jgi:type II secretory pathway pseudopilin PulG